MRNYVIGNNGITVCGEPPAALNEGEIVVASKEELHAAALSGKRLLATVECSARCREAQEGRQPRRSARRSVVGRSRCCRTRNQNSMRSARRSRTRSSRCCVDRRA